METYVNIGIGVLIGVYVMYTHIRMKLIDKKIDATIENIPSAETLAKEILAVKMPMSDLPEDTVKMLKDEEKKKKDNSYFG